MKQANHNGIYEDVICVTKRVPMTRFTAHCRAARWRRLFIHKMRAGLCPLCGTWHISTRFP